MGKGKAPGYAAAPWVFKGRALYQLQLVKLAEAQKYIPPELSIVSLFGYTLGGFYLARYDDSPVGAFEECVALAGIVWNKPTSCAWAARVYVNDSEARSHGRRHVGLPSRLSRFETVGSSAPGAPSWWDQPLAKPARRGQRSAAAEAGAAEPGQHVLLHNSEPRASWQPWRRRGGGEGLQGPVCAFSGFPSGVGQAGPPLKLSLPSFAGLTPDCPAMLRYACQLATRARLVRPLAVSCPEEQGRGSQEDLRAILTGRPVLAIAFDDMTMTVHEPAVVPQSLPPRGDWQLQPPGAAPRLLPA